MKKVMLLLTMVVFSGFIVPGQRPAAEDKTLLLTTLQESKDNLLKTLAGLTDAQMEFKTAPDRWSIIECVEHITQIEKAISEGEQHLIQQAPNPERRKD